MPNAVRQTSIWSNLPSDLLILIMQNLSYIEQIYFRAVCKNWRFNIHEVVKYSNKMSWIFGFTSFEYHHKVIKTNADYLFDPTYKRKYIIESEILVGAKVHTSKYGWLLLFKETKFTFLFYFYCPFTNQIIQLPELKKDFSNSIPKATFSMAPTSSHCVICVAVTKIYRCPSGKYNLILSTCSPKDNSWNMVSFYTAYEMWFSEAAYVGGVFYFICAGQARFKPIKIGVCKLALQEWKTYEGPNFNDSSLFYGYYLIESYDDENLLIACYNMRIRGAQWQVFRFEPTEMNWREVESLGDKMLCLGLTSISILGSKLANTIHETTHDFWLQGHYCSSKFYKGSKSQLCPQIYGWIEVERISKIWIQPPEFGMGNRPNNSNSWTS